MDNLGVWNKKAKLLAFFLRYPTREIHLRALSREIGLSTTMIAKAAKRLAKEGILTIVRNKERKEVLMKANRDCSSYRALKQSFNISFIHQSGLVEYLAKLYHHPDCIVLFGSYAKGEDTENSDIDIAVLTDRKAALSLEKFEALLHRKIAIKEFNKRKIEKEFWNTLANGIVVSGYLEVPI